MISLSSIRVVSAMVVIAAVLAFTGCGQRSSLIPQSNAEPLQQKLDEIDRLLASGECVGLPSAIADAQEQVNAFPSSVDRALRARIEEGLANLTTQAPRDCAEGVTTTTTTQTTATTTTPPTTATQTTPTATTPVPTVEPTTPAPTPTATTPTPPPAPTVTSPPPPTGGAGTGGSGGTGGASPNTGGASP